MGPPAPLRKIFGWARGPFYIALGNSSELIFFRNHFIPKISGAGTVLIHHYGSPQGFYHSYKLRIIILTTNKHQANARIAFLLSLVYILADFLQKDIMFCFIHHLAGKDYIHSLRTKDRGDGALP